MHHIIIGIPTYKRPLMLQKLVRSLYACRIDSEFVRKVEIMVVDNDGEKSAEKIALLLKAECPEHISFIYHNFKEKGLAKIRNEILEMAIGRKPDYIAFLDDDTFVVNDWLNEMTKAMTEYRADIIQGPSVPYFEIRPKPEIARWFQHLDLGIKGARVQIETNNLALRTAFLVDNDLSFDRRFNITGGEDTYFGVQALKKKAKTVWAKNAICHETITPSRASLDWLVKRKYRGATTYSYILRLERDFPALLKKFVVSLAYLIFGFLGMALIPFPITNRYWGLMKFSEGLGGFAGMMGIRYKEYSQ